MRLEPNLEDQELLADTRRRAGSHMDARELLAELIVGCGFVAAAAGVWLVGPAGRISVLPVILCGAVMVVATRVRFDTPFGFTVATQLAFVPLVFALPPAVVPIAVVVTVAVACVPDILAGRMRPGKLLRSPANSWFAIGPALVFALAGVTAQRAGLLLLLVALAAQFAGDIAASTVRVGIARGASIRSQLRENWVYAIDAALSGVAVAVAREADSAPYAVLVVVPLLGLLAMFANERQGRLGSLLELKDTYKGTALLLGDVISADDGYTGEHSEGVVGLAKAVADRLGLDAERRRNLEFGALLHDVGKIAIPKEIINKPGKLDPGEWELIKTHTVEGERMLRTVGGFMREVGLIVRSHHERWDGGGYPDGLVGEAIPLEARIITCCDSWSAMRTNRSYRAALPFETALAEMRDNAGSQFDPAVVAALVWCVQAERAHAGALPAQAPITEQAAEPVAAEASAVEPVSAEPLAA